MKETEFIAQNKDKWKRFEELNKQKHRDPDELSRLFVEITEDLSYARTHYPRRSVRVYLNYMAQHVFTSLYRIRKESLGRFVHFWTRGLPLELYRSRSSLLIAFVIFILAAAIGVASTANDLNFARIILSDDYIAMTDSFIEEGDPMAVYKQMDGLPMFVYIFFNNIRVAFFCFIFGIFLGVGTGFFLVYNGIMVGTFQSYFYYKGLTISAVMGKSLLLSTFLTIWIHGAFEISAIVIAAAAGIVLSRGLLFPGTYSRMQSLQISAKRGLKIMLGLTPFIFIAAVLESWVTRHTEMPDALKWFIIIGSFLIMILYFVVYPFFVARRYPEQVALQEEPLYHPPRKLQLQQIRQPNELFSDAFAWYRNTFRYFGGFIWGITIPIQLLYIGWLYLEYPSAFQWELAWYDNLAAILPGSQFNTVPHVLFHTFYWTLLVVSVLHALHYKPEKGRSLLAAWWRFTLRKFPRLFLPVLLVCAVFSWFPPLALFFTLFLAPVLFYFFYPMAYRQSAYPKIWVQSITSGFNHWVNGFLLFFVLLLISASFFLLLSGAALVSEILLELIAWHVVGESVNYILVENFIKSILYLVFFQLVAPLFLAGFGLFYHSCEEKEQAVGLFERLGQFGKKNKIYEMESDYED